MYLELPDIIQDKNATIAKMDAVIADMQQKLKRMEEDKNMWMKKFLAIDYQAHVERGCYTTCPGRKFK